jgi:predicted GNAT family N-acyltransferase
VLYDHPMTVTIETRVATTAPELAWAHAVRHEVFVQEQGVPDEIERDILDAVADHVVGFVDGVPLGAGRLIAQVGGDPETGLLGRLAVLKEARGAGLGAALVLAIEEQAARRGLAAVELHAQTQARGFYERLGYTVCGAEYEEAGIAHLPMRKALG